MFALPRALSALRAAVPKAAVTIRSFSALTPTRPMIVPTLRTATPHLSLTPTPLAGATDALAPRISDSLSAMGAGQVRFGPRDNFNAPTHRVRKRRHGFLSRTRTRTGRAILKRRRGNGKKVLSH